jgi:hypothetical protein
MAARLEIDQRQHRSLILPAPMRGQQALCFIRLTPLVGGARSASLDPDVSGAFARNRNMGGRRR